MAPRRSRRLNPPNRFDGLSDELLLTCLARAPFTSHDSLGAVSTRFNTLITSPAFREERVAKGMVEWGIVVAGGFADDFSEGLSLLYAGSTVKWIAPMITPRFKACTAVMNNELWVIGGKAQTNSSVAAVEAYSPATNTWGTLAPLNQPREGAVCGIIGGRLIVAGGCGEDGFLASVEAYSPAGWTALSDMPHPAFSKLQNHMSRF